ncbi:SusC/RagA family TonB-linked outer membrane protein [Pararcticibacter amylolyticus]|uniref:SusC/RagA family TonB-linked outer membrane protein n=1 Tax=Pararcticibacter amylolyticus TaxID=2173175 RepID=A0A2U2PL76_9SPHI|nr:SusC/RagA family TonB-linked outer membrane protein [Pararcticibacter amylolyticus]PWG81919.1 SusC/RagA family TonB-linked outer membrane protein [Pararcticibacter amylolyticus]
MLKIRVQGILLSCFKQKKEHHNPPAETPAPIQQPATEKLLGQYLLCFYILMVILFSLMAIVSTYAQTAVPISGKVTDEKGEGLAGAIIKIKNTTLATSSGKDGTFQIKAPSATPTLIISFIGYRSQEHPLKPGQTSVSISLNPDNTQLSEVQVVSTGYQQLPKERATGSFVQIDSVLLNRRISTNILDRLDGLVSGLIFNKNAVSTPGANISAISIRGRSTIFAEAEPLIVLDNFPYDGELSNINPNDIASVSVLRDAAAASIWGARSGNGVIVLTSKTGRLNQVPKVGFNSNVSVTTKPDLFYQPTMSTADYISVEQFLFDQQYFNSRISSEYLSLSPVVEILNRKKLHQVSDAEAADQIRQLQSLDVRNDLLKYYYRQGISQQYSLSISGGGSGHRYYASAGYDQTKGTLVFDKQKRITVNVNDQYTLLKGKLEIGANLVFSTADNHSQSSKMTGTGVRYPYVSLADSHGNALPVYKDYRKSWLDTAGKGTLLNWEYKPLEEIGQNNNTSSLTDYRLNTSVNYRIIKGLKASFLYQYSKGTSELNDLNAADSYYTRNLVNQYAQLNYNTLTVQRPVPLGGILNSVNAGYTTSNIRAQLNFDTLHGPHRISAIAGTEFKDYATNRYSNTVYGYNPENETFSFVDYTTTYRTRPQGFFYALPNAISRRNTTDHYLSYFGNASYTYNGRYTLSASARKDESNLFGVNTNQKGVPLWSAGLAWNISDEKFYHSAWLPYLKLRFTTGYNGNVDKSLSALTTASLSGTNVYQAQYAVITNPPNPELRWEKIRMLNLAADFSSANKRLSGSLEYYQKKGKDMIGTSPLAPQTGVTTFKGNTANISGSGLDLSLNALIINKPLQWSAVVQYSYTKDKVDQYLYKQPAVNYYVSGNYSQPIEGYPYMALFSYKWAGLDPQTGDPRGYVEGSPSSVYANLLNPASIDDVVYNGSQVPVSFGNFRNTFTWKGISLSANITWKLGYVFRRPSVNYYSMYSAMLNNSAGTAGHADFALRWQKPGDELHTNVPSVIYPVSNANRDDFYSRSEILVEKGDHIRLQDLQCSYSVPIAWLRKVRLRSASVYGYVNNIGILWKASSQDLDPDYILGTPSPLSFSLGIQAAF